MASITSLEEYYASPFVRERIREYCGVADGRPPTSVYLSALTGREGPLATWNDAPRYPVGALDSLLSAGADIARSAWDRADLLIHVDIDYQNVDVPAEAFLHPAEVFFKLEPIYRAALHTCRRFGIALMPLMTGRGYHFTGRVPLGDAVVDRLASIVPDPPRWLATLAGRQGDDEAPEVSVRHAKAYVGAGMLVEFLAHRMLRRAARRSPIPIVLNGTVVGSGLVGRECASIDLSYAGDPMDLRHMRVAFGAYQKHRFRPDIIGHRGASERPPFIAVPRGGESLAHLLSHGREFAHAERAARTRSTALPVVADGVGRALDAYERSTLARFHREFYASPRRSAAEVLDIFRALPLRILPACVARPLLAPNDLLLQPASLQHVTRALLADGMAPRDIAALVCSRYDAPFGWGARWSRQDAETRAEFDVRVFTGLLVTGTDRALDFNCRSAQEKGLCPGGRCDEDLRDDRARLMKVVG
ncbi:MAG: hypothetical protein ACHQO8_09385 [Vicinamibacterales bacterium]